MVARGDLPADALLRRYRGAGAYTDCYETRVPGEIDLARFVEAFYTGGVFRIERLLLHWFAARPSTDEDARGVARGDQDHFAAWTVEARTAEQLLMCDMAGRTRSWFMVAPGDGGTVLRFGSAVVPVRDPASDTPRMGGLFRALLGFHRVYSRVLLRAAARRAGAAAGR